MRVVAVDWSGRRSGAARHIWTAEVVDGRLESLENGRPPPAAIDHLVALAARGPLVAGLDFAFGFPEWWARERGWTAIEDVWAAMREDGEALLAACAPPFWGRAGTRAVVPGERRVRVTDRECRAQPVFKIGGAGSVGTGSVRGMPQLLRLAGAGFAVWPFDDGNGPRVVEIYPRTLYPEPVVKSDPAARRGLLDRCFAHQPRALLDRAAGSEDAFDAAVSALVMARHANVLAGLRADAAYALEGRIWRP